MFLLFREDFIVFDRVILCGKSVNKGRNKSLITTCVGTFFDEMM